MRVGWNESSAVIRNGCSGVESSAGSPPSESVRSAATMRPPWSQGSVKSSSVTSTMLPSCHAEARTAPSSGRVELWMKSVCGWATPFAPPGDAAAGDEHRVPRLARTRILPVRGSRQRAARGVAAQAAAAADPGDAVLVDVDVVRVVGQPVVAAQVDRLREGLGCAGSLEVGDPDRPAVAARRRA